VRPNGQILDSLKRNSGEFFDEAEQFRDICGGIKISSLYETLLMGSFGLVGVVASIHPWKSANSTYFV
jgi:hypothetical protein